MVAISFMTGTKYACNERNVCCLIWMQSNFSKGTIYACNLVHREPDMLAMSKVVLESHNYDFWTNLAKKIFR